MGSRKRPVHAIVADTSTAALSYTTDPIHAELTDGICFQVNYTGAAIQSITVSLQGSVDYNLVTSGDEKWTTLQSSVCTETSGYIMFNVPHVYVPYYRIVVAITSGTPYDRLQVFKYSRESV